MIFQVKMVSIVALRISWPQHPSNNRVIVVFGEFALLLVMYPIQGAGLQALLAGKGRVCSPGYRLRRHHRPLFSRGHRRQVGVIDRLKSTCVYVVCVLVCIEFPRIRFT